MAKMQLSVDDSLLVKIDKYCEKMYMSRSGFVSYACAQVINSQELIIAITDVTLALKKISESNEITQDDADKLADFERIVKMLTGSK